MSWLDVFHMEIESPVTIDSDYWVWRAFSNHYRLAVYIADAHARIRYHQFGEGRYEACERVIQRLLREAGVEDVGEALVSVAADGFEASADWTNLASSETYLGYEQTQNFGGLDDRERGQRAERSRGRDRVPLQCPRRASRRARTGARDVRAVPSAHRRRDSAMRMG